MRVAQHKMKIAVGVFGALVFAIGLMDRELMLLTLGGLMIGIAVGQFIKYGGLDAQ